ncbi:ribosomal protein L25/Gln-tRNA synthetase, anti-codon-binding domain-containing protein [Actinidia rufa]|uniref:Ribosomal protein L25/Gln-tRNA synthetase, anti-codon-binding domain-containing protein n=1 Tax=Actinidia rufa TaxID=165716 RepID=A0A7J0G7B0_9ERIC|nr:ribosomal protein L25/Gln-tRNA synthetase, anti-codon-binding domain-containing protein [Actinidia rufa]
MEYQENQNPYLSRQHSNLLDDVFGLEFGPDLEVEEPGKEEGAAKAGDDPPDLVGLDGDEALVAAVLAILLLEHDAGDAAGLALLGGDGLAGGGAWDCVDGLGMFGSGLGRSSRFMRGASGSCSRVVAADWLKCRRWRVLLSTGRWIHIGWRARWASQWFLSGGMSVTRTELVDPRTSLRKLTHFPMQ